ncbi:MAG: hypothetical protein A3E78_00300 [Alphaproteobacteria bacterium RIFCSPHIGHO2_12_FULL_63_12]|nr:MAG: hypothetical protein A3E78_00300 [Alphaproteobacteria bacterium RIFCSPHIGHO2_12_FULL_63_12]
MSGGADSGQDKSFDPTPSRLERARREGDVPLSREGNAAAAYLGLYLVIVAAAGSMAMGLVSFLPVFFHSPEVFFAAAPGARSAAFAALAVKITAAVAAFFAVPAACVAASIQLQQGFVFAPTRLKPKLSRLSPIDNAKQKFGPSGLSEFLISAIKLLGIMALFATFFWSRFVNLPGAALVSPAGVVAAVHEMAALFIGVILVFSLAIGAVDIIRVRAQHKKRLMMSLEEIRQESKETDGDPHFKSKRRERSRAIAMNRMLIDVPKASVVIVNPTHYAVALRWDGPKSGAPTCVAKGVDELAAKIREIAAENGVPIRRDAPTARAIYGAVEVGEEIRREHFAAVAAAIHFADAIRRAAKE